MSISRIFHSGSLQTNAIVQLDDGASHHLARVLRANVNDTLVMFNGQGGEYEAVISRIDKKTVTVQLGKHIAREAESPVAIYLAQGISRGEKMDYTIQKAVELGVKEIIPLITERCTVRLDEERREKRLQHWQSIVVSACEQSGRNQIPGISSPQRLMDWLPPAEADACFVLSPHAQNRLIDAPIKKATHIILLIGPEGGLSEAEIKLACQKNFFPLNLGPRVLRTETAAVAAITALQCRFGDMG